MSTANVFEYQNMCVSERNNMHSSLGDSNKIVALYFPYNKYMTSVTGGWEFSIELSKYLTWSKDHY